jgi:hypothetical protein
MSLPEIRNVQLAVSPKHPIYFAQRSDFVWSG